MVAQFGAKILCGGDVAVRGPGGIALLQADDVRINCPDQRQLVFPVPISIQGCALLKIVGEYGQPVRIRHDLGCDRPIMPSACRCDQSQRAGQARQGRGSREAFGFCKRRPPTRQEQGCRHHASEDRIREMKLVAEYRAYIAHIAPGIGKNAHRSSQRQQRHAQEDRQSQRAGIHRFLQAAAGCLHIEQHYRREQKHQVKQQPGRQVFRPNDHGRCFRRGGKMNAQSQNAPH